MNRERKKSKNIAPVLICNPENISTNLNKNTLTLFLITIFYLVSSTNYNCSIFVVILTQSKCVISLNDFDKIKEVQNFLLICYALVTIVTIFAFKTQIIRV